MLSEGQRADLWLPEPGWISPDPGRMREEVAGRAGCAAGAASQRFLPPAANLQLQAPSPERERERERESLRVLSDEVIPKKDKGSGACINLSGDVSREKAD